MATELGATCLRVKEPRGFRQELEGASPFLELCRECGSANTMGFGLLGSREYFCRQRRETQGSRFIAHHSPACMSLQVCVSLHSEFIPSLSPLACAFSAPVTASMVTDSSKKPLYIISLIICPSLSKFQIPRNVV